MNLYPMIGIAVRYERDERFSVASDETHTNLTRVSGRFCWRFFLPLCIAGLQPLRTYVEIGRVAYLTQGKQRGKLCTIVNVVDQNRVSYASWLLVSRFHSRADTLLPPDNKQKLRFQLAISV